MSIVEKALRKFQDLQPKDKQAAAPEPLVLGKVVQADAVQPEQAAVQKPAPGASVSLSTKLVRIDRNALRTAMLLPPESEERELGHQYRTIKRPLIRSAFDPATAGEGIPRQLIMLASALPGDGKTFTTINLALSMSLEKDHPVLLVDGDVAKPNVSDVFGVMQEPGLLDVLSDTSRPVEEYLRSLILPTDVPGLFLLPAGTRSETAAELLASDRMRAVIRCLSTLYSRGIVLFDSSPVLLTTEARTLASLVGQVVLVVKADSTPQQAVEDTIKLLEGVQSLSLVLNQAELSGPTGYYYGYNYGAKSEPAPPAEPSSSP